MSEFNSARGAADAANALNSEIHHERMEAGNLTSYARGIWTAESWKVAAQQWANVAGLARQASRLSYVTHDFLKAEESEAARKAEALPTTFAALAAEAERTFAAVEAALERIMRVAPDLAESRVASRAGGRKEDPPSPDRPLDWPTPDKVRLDRAHAREQLTQLNRSEPTGAQIDALYSR